MAKPRPPLCWICRTRQADSSEHMLKASDVRSRVSDLSQKNPIFLQINNQATNIRIGSSRSERLTFEQRICAYCNNTLTRPYDLAWQTLSEYLCANWPQIKRLRRFDLSGPFPGATRRSALLVHLYFVKLFGCKLNDENDDAIDLGPFSDALTRGKPHPEVHLLFCNDDVASDYFLFYNSEIHVLERKADSQALTAVWMYGVRPMIIKVAYIRSGAPFNTPGDPWHPAKAGKIVKLSPFMGGSNPAIR